MGKPLDPHTAPPGHNVSAHRAHGWCSRCRGRSRAQELTAWRTLNQEQHAADAATEADQMVATSTDYRTCPACHEKNCLAVVTVTVRTISGSRQVAGGWVHCLNCEAPLGSPPTVGGAAEGDDRPRPLTDLMSSGLLWLINRTVFHPRGLSLGLGVEGDQVRGWQLLRADKDEPFQFPADVDRDCYRRAEATLRAALDQEGPDRG